MSPLRTNIYIDGFNFYYGLLKNTPYKWLNLDTFCRAYLDPGKNEIIKIKYFTALVKSRPNDPDQHIRQQTYLRALKTLPNIEILYGHFLTHEIMMPRADGGGLVKVIKTEEKKSDVNVAVHMLNDAYRDEYDCAVLVSNDSDLSEPLRIIKNDLKKVIGVLNPHNNPSSELTKYAHFIKKLRAGTLSSFQFPVQLTDKNGTITKPSKW